MTNQLELPVAHEICPTTTRKALAAGALLVDVREAHEVAAVAFADCDVLHIPLSELETRWAEIPRDRDVVFACAIGERSLKATYFLMYKGYERVANMKYGIRRWIERGFPVNGDSSMATVGQTSSCCCGEEDHSASEASCGCASKSEDTTGNCC